MSDSWNLQTYLQERYKTELASAFQCQLCGRYDTRVTIVHNKLYHLQCAAKVMSELIEPVSDCSNNNSKEATTCALPQEKF